MYYSSIGILATLVLVIIDFKILISPSHTNKRPAHKAYKQFLISVLAYYFVDVIWEALYELKLTAANFIETTLYFIVMALSVILWTRYVIVFLNKKNKFAKFLLYTGFLLFCFQVIVLIINFFVPIVFWFNKDGVYEVGIARDVNLLIQVIMFMIVAIYMIIHVVRSKSKLKRRHCAVGIFSFIMIIFVALQAIHPFMPFYAIGYMLGICILHTFVLEDEKETWRKELESLLKIEEIQEIEIGKVRQMAYTDPLTCVKNKMSYIEDVGSIEQQIENGEIEDFGLIVLDLNDLKKINDTKGHDSGDQYIKAGCTLICNTFKHSPVYRIGGDEFTVFLSGEDYENHKQLLEELKEAVEYNKSTGGVVIAYGFADYKKMSGKSFMRLFESADKKMYKCKQALKSNK